MNYGGEISGNNTVTRWATRALQCGQTGSCNPSEHCWHNTQCWQGWNSTDRGNSIHLIHNIARCELILYCEIITCTQIHTEKIWILTSFNLSRSLLKSILNWSNCETGNWRRLIPSVNTRNDWDVFIFASRSLTCSSNYNEMT